MGNLFLYKKVQPSELKAMQFPELRYWNHWVELEIAERKRQEEAAKR
jgi:hypothetical protein